MTMCTLTCPTKSSSVKGGVINVANSQTVGYKAVDTSFIDYLTTSTSQANEPGAVATLPDYTNADQGTITQSTDNLALAIAGQGFFAVSTPDGVAAGGSTTSFNPQTYYTRAGDFALELGKREQHVERQPPHRARGIKLLRNRHERNILPAEDFDDLGEIHQRSGQPSTLYMTTISTLPEPISARSWLSYSTA